MTRRISITNTTAQMEKYPNPFAGLPSAIEASESMGQHQLVASSDLPVKVQSPETDETFKAMGISLGQPYEDDPLFRPAKLPLGWRREPSDHSMWSYVVDETGEKRIAIFYKAAFYDRRAFMRSASR